MNHMVALFLVFIILRDESKKDIAAIYVRVPMFSTNVFYTILITTATLNLYDSLIT